MEGLYLNTMQTLYETPRANAEFNGDKGNAFLLNKKSMPSLLILIQHRVTWKEQERQTIKMHLATERKISATSDTPDRTQQLLLLCLEYWTLCVHCFL